MMKRLSISIASTAGAAFALVPSWVWAQGASPTERFEYGPQMMGWGGGWYGMFFGPLFMILVLVVVITAVVLLVRWLADPWQGSGRPHQGASGRQALDVLKERFARGEIDKNEFEERRRVLGE